MGSIRKGGVWWPLQDRIKDYENMPVVDVLIPALNEEDSLGQVIDDIPMDLVRRVIVVDNGSTDQTADIARAAGAEVVYEHQRGYGAACLAGLAYMSHTPPDIVVFLDADYSDYPEQLTRVIEPIVQGDAQLVIGSRTLGVQQPGALLPQAIFGNKLACTLLRLLYGYRFSDLGPFRAISWSALQAIQMRDRDFGWTVEMQIKAAKMQMSTVEVPVSYRKRIGQSKITGTIRGTVLAGHKILYTIFAQYKV